MHDGKKVEGSVSSWTPTLTENGRVRTPTGSPTLIAAVAGRCDQLLLVKLTGYTRLRSLAIKAFVVC